MSGVLNLRYVLIPILGINRPELEGKCATDCATFWNVCNRTNKTLGPTEEGVFPGASTRPLASGHIAQTFRALPGVGLDKAAKGKRQIVVPMPILRSG